MNLECRFQPFGRNRPISTEKLKIFDAIFAEFVFPQKFVKVGNAVKNVNKLKKNDFFDEILKYRRHPWLIQLGNDLDQTVIMSFSSRTYKTSWILVNAAIGIDQSRADDSIQEK